MERAEPLCPALLDSSVRIGRGKKSGKPDLTLQPSAPREWRKRSQEFGGLEMRLKEEDPHPRKEAKAVTAGGQVSEGTQGEVAEGKGNSDFSLVSRPGGVLQALRPAATRKERNVHCPLQRT